MKHKIGLIIFTLLHTKCIFSQNKEWSKELNNAINKIEKLTMKKAKNGFAFSYTVLGLGEFESYTLSKKNSRIIKTNNLFNDKIYKRSKEDTSKYYSTIFSQFINAPKLLFTNFKDSINQKEIFRHDYLIFYVSYRNNKLYEKKFFYSNTLAYNRKTGTLDSILETMDEILPP